MKTIVGIDETKRHCATLDLLSRLNFQKVEIDLVHVVPTVASYVSMYSAYVVLNYEEMARSLAQGGRKILDDAVDDACGRGLKANTHLMIGTKAEGISTAADERHADLVAIASGPKGPLDRLLSGSLAQSLAIAAHQSLLVVRGKEGRTGPVTAVFATDHSNYSNQCLERLLSWVPKGLKHVRVVTAYDLVGHETGLAGHQVAVKQCDVDAFVRNQIAAKTDVVAQRFRDHGVSADASIVEEEINTAIHEAMELAEADLLIMGARGHGFWDRLLLGSTAQHQVIAEPYPVLLLRIPNQELLQRTA